MQAIITIPFIKIKILLALSSGKLTLLVLGGRSTANVVISNSICKNLKKPLRFSNTAKGTHHSLVFSNNVRAYIIYNIRPISLIVLLFYKYSRDTSPLLDFGGKRSIYAFLNSK